jgi:preprotein translocase subunit SecG
MYHFLMFVHVVACLAMILVVLLQTGRGAGLQMFGGGGDSLITTPGGSSFMKKFTAGLAATFAFTSLFLTLLQNRTGMSSVTSKIIDTPAPAAAPAAPAAPSAAPTSAAAPTAAPAPASTPAPAKKK